MSKLNELSFYLQRIKSYQFLYNFYELNRFFYVQIDFFMSKLNELSYYLFLVVCFCSGFLDLIGFRRRTSLRWSSNLFLGKGGFFNTFFAGFGYREAVAPSASLSPASASGRRWLPQHRWRRLSPRVFPHFDLRI